MKKFFLIIAIIILPLNKIYGENRSLKFIALGHIYPIINDEIRMNSLFKKINSHSADYVFILGDSKLNERKYYEYLNKNINSKLFFSPGNHDISGKKIENYKKNVGYMNSSFEDLGVKFILVNSSQSKDDLLNYLKKNLKDNFNGLTIILTHHRIWDDTLMSNAPYEHDKSYFFEDIYPIIKDKVDVIIAGNSKRQHFRDLMDDEFSFGKQNVNLIYWLDKIGDIELYSVGMGDGKPKANFIVAEISNNKMIVKGDYSSVESYEILPKNLIESNQLRFTIHNTTAIRKLVEEKYFLINKNKTYAILIFVISLFIFLIIKLKKK